MKRFHVHIAVEKLDDSIRFYSSLFGVAPTVVQPDYAKWMLEDPCWRAMKNSKPCAGNWKRQMPACSNKPGPPVAMPSLTNTG
jgi:predicted enzyme related to lactoylglutathione lyase